MRISRSSIMVAMGPVTGVLFEDGCGNLINFVQSAENAG